eukprot:3061414-Amphidinium_carterae.1
MRQYYEDKWKTLENISERQREQTSKAQDEAFPKHSLGMYERLDKAERENGVREQNFIGESERCVQMRDRALAEMREVQGIVEVLQRELDRTNAHHSVMNREGQNLQHCLQETEERARVQAQ